MPTKVSIIIITYNSLDDLRACLASVEMQDYSEKEIVVVNDASTDGTDHFLEEYQRLSPIDCVVVTNATNRGVAGSRNRGIRHSTGDIIAFTDADCVADRQWISELVEGYQHRHVAAVGGSISDEPITNIWGLTNKGHDYVADQEGYVSYLQGCNMSFDSAVLRKFMFNDEIKYGYEETLLCDFLIQSGYQIYYKPQSVVYHKHKNSFISLAKQKYLRGLSSVWYRKKRNRFPLFKRHAVFLTALFLFGSSLFNNIFGYIALFLFLIFLFSLLRDELIFGGKNAREMIITFPILVLIEWSHFGGSIAGLIRFWIFQRNISQTHLTG